MCHHTTVVTSSPLFIFHRSLCKSAVGFGQKEVEEKEDIYQKEDSESLLQ